MPRVSRRKALTAILGRQRREAGSGVSDENTTFTGSPFDVDTGGPTWTGTLTVKDAGNVAIPNVQAATSISLQRVSAANTFVTSDVTVMDADGVDVCTITIQAMQVNLDGDNYVPIVGIPAANISIAVSGSNNTITQPATATDEDGRTTASFTTTTAQVKTITATILSLAMTQQPTVDAGGSIIPPGPGDPFYETEFADTTLSNNNDNGFTWGSLNDTSVQAAPGGGRNAIRFRYTPTASAEQRYNMGRDVPHLWIEYDLYIPSNFVHSNETPNNNKLHMIWRDTYSDVAGGTLRTGWEYYRVSGTVSNARGMSSRWNYNSWESSNPYGDYAPTGQYGTLISSSGPITIGDWTQIRIELKTATDDNSSDGIQRMWCDGVLVFEITTAKFWNYPTGSEPADCHYRNGYFMGAANAAFAETTDIYVASPKFYESDPGW